MEQRIDKISQAIIDFLRGSTSNPIPTTASGSIPTTIVFVERREEAKQLATKLGELLTPEPVQWVTAERSVPERAALVEDMKAGRLRMVVATSAWSTGINIPCLRYVMLTGKGKAPIGLLQSAGRATRPDGTVPYEIVNIWEEGNERQARQRAEVLDEHGFKSEEGFLDDAANQPDPPVVQPTVFNTFFGPAAPFGSIWVWAIALAIMIIQALGHLACC